MTTKNKKIVLATSLLVAAGGIGFLIYKRQVNKRNSGLMLEYINSLLKENTARSQNESSNLNVDVSKNINTLKLDALKQYKVALVALDGKWYNLGNATQRKTAIDIASNIAIELYFSMNRLGIDKIKFDRNFRRIGSNGAFILVNTVYISLYKKDLWKDIEGEEVLYKGAGNGWNAVIGMFQDLPNYDIVISEQARVWNTLEKQLKTK